MMKANSSCCGGATDTCNSTIAELPRYYPRQLITPDDLTLEQNYFRDRMRRHNRLLHGWGVVCGALVCPVTTKDASGVASLVPWHVQVQRGYILGPYGDEIILDCVRTVDLRTTGVSGVTGDPCIDVPDPWCTQVSVPRTTGTLYIAAKYKQSMTRPVRVQPIGCGCDDNTCECSRWHDGYEIRVLTCCPDDKNTPPKTSELFLDGIPECPACPSQPWVVLAAVQVEEDGTVSSINNCECRRMVGSLGSFWWQCKQGDTTIGEVSPSSINPGSATTLTITGSNLDETDTYTFGNGVMVTSVKAKTQGTSMEVSIKVDSTASTGSRTLVIVSKDCNTVTKPDAITVASPKPAAPTAPAATGTRPPAKPTKPAKKVDPSPQ